MRDRSGDHPAGQFRLIHLGDVGVMVGRIGLGDVHVWRMKFVSADPAERAWSIMSNGERSRAAAFRFAPDRNRFCQSRFFLRQVLGSYLHLDPCDLEFVEDAYGKPLLKPAGALRFNLSHCRSLALLAISSDQAVGIDVEDGTSLRGADVATMANDHFTESEARTILALSGFERTRAFLTCWTRKEALLKAAGVGLAGDLKRFEVPLDGARKWRVAWTPPEGAIKVSAFDMVDLTSGDDFAAVAAPTITGPVSICEFDGLDPVIGSVGQE